MINKLIEKVKKEEYLLKMILFLWGMIFLTFILLTLFLTGFGMLIYIMLSTIIAFILTLSLDVFKQNSKKTDD